ncbi:hypothetical protein HWV62_44079 [Athelia sp. TMB]|nr:hypothetical protein HWV62_44079 [Athelia sp. TMB]
MRAYYLDNIPGDRCLLHDSGKAVSRETLQNLNLFYWNIPIDPAGQWQATIDEVAKSRDYKNRDILDLTTETLGKEKMDMFFAEHMHEDEEIRFILNGSGFFDVREHPTDAWIRVHMLPGDLLVLPAGIYHRFTLDESGAVKTMRLFKDEPRWLAHNRGTEADSNPYRINYLSSLRKTAVA